MVPRGLSQGYSPQGLRLGCPNTWAAGPLLLCARCRYGASNVHGLSQRPLTHIGLQPVGYYVVQDTHVHSLSSYSVSTPSGIDADVLDVHARACTHRLTVHTRSTMRRYLSLSGGQVSSRGSVVAVRTPLLHWCKTGTTVLVAGPPMRIRQCAPHGMGLHPL